ncbi:MAG: DNA polymerase III subunit beta [FCB group bacterium]|jgi:DNA polymerase-3 subunit beta
MKFSISLSDFQKILQKTIPAIPRKSTLPILEHLLFNLSGNSLKLIATDQDITIMSTVAVEGDSDGKILVPGRRINDIVNALGKEGSLEFATKEGTYEIKIQTSSGKYSMKGLDPDEYLDIPELFDSEKPVLDTVLETASLSAGKIPPVLFKKHDITRIANKTFFAVSTDEFRPAMNGVLFQFRESYLNGVSTDSYRLVRIKHLAEKNIYPKDLDLIIPARAIDLLRRVDDDVIMSMIETKGKISHVRFDVAETVFITRLIDEKFPPYESVIPLNNDLIVLLNQKDILAAIKRVSIFTNEISHQIRVRMDTNMVMIIGEDEETGSNANETIVAEFTGKKFDVGFNYVYLEEAIQNVETESDNQILLTFSEPARPVIVKPNKEGEDILMLIMPVRL